MLTSTYVNAIWVRTRLVEFLRARRSEDRGAALVEYAFLLVLIVVVCIGAVTLLGTTNSGSANKSANSIINAN